MEVLYGLSYGMFVVASKSRNKINGQISNTVFQVAGTPELVAISINKNNLTHIFIKDSGLFAVSILTQPAPMSLIGRFGFRSGRDINKFEGVEHILTDDGLPVLTSFVKGYFIAKVVNEIDAGTHTVFIGKVEKGELLDREAKVMTYEYYRLKKKGKTPDTAPTSKK